MKKVLSVLMAFAMVLALLPAGLLSVSALQEGDYTYTIADSKATITKYTGAGGDVTIPDILGGYPVSAICTTNYYNSVFPNNLVSIILPESVINVGAFAFYGCSSLSSITMRGNITSIDLYAFSGCSGLSIITIPESVIQIGDRAFENTAWYNSKPDGVVVYAGKVAYKYKGVMPAGTEIVLLNDTVGIAGGAFWGCSGLNSIEIPEGVKNIGNCAFYSCTGLKNITIPNGVTEIKSQTFSGCTGLISVAIPSSVIMITDYAFEECTAIASINVSENNSMFSSVDGVLYNKAKTAVLKCPEGKIGSITIQTGVKAISKYAFFHCKSLTNITIPDGVYAVGSNAFSGCTGLTSVTIPNSLTYFAEGSGLGNCPNLTIYCYEDSIAEVFALVNKIPYTIIESTAVTGVTLNQETVDLTVNETAQLSATVAPVYATNQSITWGSMNNEVASVSSTGLVTAKSVGTATINATTVNGGFIASCVISVENNKIAAAQGSSLIVNAIDGFITNIPSAGALISEMRQLLGNKNIRFLDINGIVIPDTGTAGNGTRLQLLNSIGTIIDELTIVIFGDVNGDSSIDSMDAGIIVDHENYIVTWDPISDAAFIKAGDLNGDGVIDSIDAGIAVDAENYLVTIDQSTGLAS